MHFELTKSIEILERTPEVLQSLLQGISPDWTTHNEGGESWTACDIIGHLIHGEKTDWIPRLEIILSDNSDKTFEPFDRQGQFSETKQTLDHLLREFGRLRQQNLAMLRSKNLEPGQLAMTGIHPVFGEVSLAQLLATWTVHDLNHLAQISRVMAKQYKEEVGPWVEYLGILQKK